MHVEGGGGRGPPGVLISARQPECSVFGLVSV